MEQSIHWIHSPKSLAHVSPYLKVRLLGPSKDDNLQFELNTDRGPLKITVPSSSSFDAGQDNNYQDMCEMDILNEPEVLSNLIRRYHREQIFTNIGPTLIAVNPYHHIDTLFSQATLERAKEATLAGRIGEGSPHVYKLAGQAFEAIHSKKGKQSIVISGESGAGKTESTKYCMQLLTALGPRKSHSIEEKILAANPVLEAFGNSKTIRNENSSRFGKFMNIYFQEGGHIIGATIQSYLLQKSRVVSVSLNQRNFHAFYALAASGRHHIGAAQEYQLLKQSHCYNSTHIDDSQYYDQINKSFLQIGFEERSITKIWDILASILELGNIDFDETSHLIDESQPCTLRNVQSLPRIAATLALETRELEKMLLFEKRKFLKEYTHISYGKAGSKANQQALCKALYESLFDFILCGVQVGLRPQGPVFQGQEIAILDIFGFQNFDDNSFQQFCINYTNERLLRLYNHYVFQKEMEILKEDGLEEQVVGLVPPSNQSLIALISGKMSLFSIVNDMTLPQFKDEDIIHGFKKLTFQQLKFDKLKPWMFTLSHSPCSVTYSSRGFKSKNQDRVNEDTLQLLGRLWGEPKESTGKTILSKFSKQMQDLMIQLESSQVHFIRCIKPNELKRPRHPDEHCILTQIRYLGVLQTIFIRKNTFPYRKLYSDFKRVYCIVFKILYQEGDDRQLTREALKQVQAEKGQYLLGRIRIYMTEELEDRLSQTLFQCQKMRSQKARILQKAAKTWLWKISVKQHLNLFSRRLKILKNLPSKLSKLEIVILRQAFLKLHQYGNEVQEKINREQEQVRLAMLKQAKLIREQQRLLHNRQLQNAQREEGINEHQELSPLQSSFVALTGDIPKDSSKAQGLSLNLNETELVSNRQIDPRVPYVKPETPSSDLMGKSLTFNEQFMNRIEYRSEIDLSNSSIAFEGELEAEAPLKDPQSLKKLKDILEEKYQIQIKGNEQDFFSPISSNCVGRITDLPAPFLSQIMDFPIESYMRGILLKRTTFFGNEKSYKQILVYKNAVLTKPMTVLTNQSDQKKALKLFELLMKAGQEEDINNLLKLVEAFLEECQNSSLELKREIMVQMIRQCTTKYELTAIRIYQTMAVFLHVYNPQVEILKATLHIFYWKLSSGKVGKVESEYLVYVFNCLGRKVQKKIIVGYLPISFQVMGLLCKRQISVPLYLPSGTSILVNVESFNSFEDIKEKCLRDFGISPRLSKNLFGFFEVVNFDNEDLEESPIRQTNVIWDMITYWELTKEKYVEGGITPPNFFLMLKIRYTVEVREGDEELMELCFAQLYFEYYMSRIFLEPAMIFLLGALIFSIKQSGKSVRDLVMGLLPIYFSKRFTKKEVIDRMQLAVSQLEGAQLTKNQMKFKFIKICQNCDLAMSVEIPVNQSFRLFLKPRRVFLIYHMNEEAQKVVALSLKSIIRWAFDKQSLTLQISRGAERATYHIKTDCSSIFNELLRALSTLNSHRVRKELSFKKK